MWTVITTDLFDAWFIQQTPELQDDLLAALKVLQEEGPQLSRPLADTVNGSKYANMKELRVQHKGDPIRAFFAFDPSRSGIVLCAGDKTGLNEKKFYKGMIKIADREYATHLNKLKEVK